MHSEEQRIYCLSKNFKHFLLDLFYIVRNNLALRILNGSLSLLYTWRSALLSFSNALLRDLRMLSLQILFSMAKSVACASENYIHVSRMGTSVPIASCCACPPQGHQTELELNTAGPSLTYHPYQLEEQRNTKNVPTFYSNWRGFIQFKLSAAAHHLQD